MVIRSPSRLKTNLAGRAHPGRLSAFTSTVPDYTQEVTTACLSTRRKRTSVAPSHDRKLLLDARLSCLEHGAGGGP